MANWHEPNDFNPTTLLGHVYVHTGREIGERMIDMFDRFDRRLDSCHAEGCSATQYGFFLDSRDFLLVLVFDFRGANHPFKENQYFCLQANIIKTIRDIEKCGAEILWF